MNQMKLWRKEIGMKEVEIDCSARALIKFSKVVFCHSSPPPLRMLKSENGEISVVLNCAGMPATRWCQMSNKRNGIIKTRQEIMTGFNWYLVVLR